MAYVQHTPEEIDRMLDAIGLRSVEDLFRSIPRDSRLERPLALHEKRTEAEILRTLRELADRNRRVDDMPSFLGAGVYDRFVPAVVDYLAGRGEFSTAYTPYQPEASQGTLQAIFEYQSMIARLTGMDISNASMYDAGTALAEAVLMAYAIDGKRSRVLVSEAVHPESRRVLETYVRNHPVETEVIGLSPDGQTDLGGLSSTSGDDVFAVVIQNPNFFGIIEEGPRVAAALGELPEPRPLLIVPVDPVSLGALAPPGRYGADIVIGDGQGLGNDPNLGGPTFAFFATRSRHVRKIPGRIVGETQDSDGRRGFVLTFQTREQHIRRERATSNICTNQGLCCLRGAMAMAFLGDAGVRQMAELSTRMAHHAFDRLRRLPGVQPVFAAPFFQEFALELPRAAKEVYRQLLERGVRGGLPLERFFAERTHQMLFATTELTTCEDVDALERELAAVLEEPSTVDVPALVAIPQEEMPKKEAPKEKAKTP